GLPLSDSEADALFACSEGWISLTYLLFNSYVNRKVWRFHSADIYDLMEEIMLRPLPECQQQFLTCCSIAESFTRQQASFLWQEDSREILDRLTSRNAFLRYEDGVYHAHNLLLHNTRSRFEALPRTEQQRLWTRLGDWHRQQQEYLNAMIAYRKAEAWELLLSTLEADNGSSLFMGQKDMVQEWITHCPQDTLRLHPDAILLLAMECFTAGEIDTLLRLRAFLLTSVEENPALTEQQRNNYKGDAEILLSMLSFNDISAMSAHQRTACLLLNTYSRLVGPDSLWTFGSPSVLMLYHSESGALDRENQDMHECMLFYYQLSNGNGNGAEHAMQIESDYMRGVLDDTEINYHLALNAARRKNQWSVLVTVEFIAMRLDLLAGNYEKMKQRMDSLRQTLKDNDQFLLFDTMDLCQGWMYALMGRTEEIPAWLLSDSAEENVPPFVAPILLTIQNQARLVTGEYAALIAHGEEYKERFTAYNMVLCRIYLHIQLAAALYHMSRSGQALTELRAAFALAAPDGILMPFAENGKGIWNLLSDLERLGEYTEEIAAIRPHAAALDSHIQNIWQEHFAAAKDYGLTDRELEVAKLAAQRKTTQEIAKVLNLSENTVKTHLKRVFNKLEIDSNSSARNKRVLLEKKMLEM
ncbi:MAG: LuxR C-terminal-related transcriptional regulator, partial [Syntrophomonadaceae bacterium]|nr:LuxR C-terminal-related transcriptional regulator [Syntrophomonadaceae bacterium]